MKTRTLCVLKLWDLIDICVPFISKNGVVATSIDVFTFALLWEWLFYTICKGLYSVSAIGLDKVLAHASYTNKWVFERWVPLGGWHKTDWRNGSAFHTKTPLNYSNEAF